MKMDGPLTPLELERLKMLKYRSVGISFLEPLFSGYWNFLTEQIIPQSWSCNSITVTGLMTNILTTSPVFYYSLNGSYEVPRWCYLLCALGVFVYQTLDAMDGCQARRTVGDDALNELFDHGCDAISSAFIAIGVCVALHLGGHPHWFLAVMFGSLTLVYFTQWQKYVTGIMKFERFDVTELQWTIISIHVISAMFGSEIWETKVAFLGLESTVLNLLLFISTLGAASRCYSNLRTIFRERGKRSLSCSHSAMGYESLIHGNKMFGYPSSDRVDNKLVMKDFEKNPAVSQCAWTKTPYLLRQFINNYKISSNNGMQSDKPRRAHH